MKLLVELRLDGAAFADPEGDRDGQEIAVILRRLAENLEYVSVHGRETGVLRDTNGNNAGTWRITSR